MTHIKFTVLTAEVNGWMVDGENWWSEWKGGKYTEWESVEWHIFSPNCIKNIFQLRALVHTQILYYHHLGPGKHAGYALRTSIIYTRIYLLRFGQWANLIRLIIINDSQLRLCAASSWPGGGKKVSFLPHECRSLLFSSRICVYVVKASKTFKYGRLFQLNVCPNYIWRWFGLWKLCLCVYRYLWLHQQTIDAKIASNGWWTTLLMTWKQQQTS